MSDAITPQLRDDVLERLRGLAMTRNFTKSPEEIERLIFDKSRGMRKTYLDLFSRVLDPTATAGATSSSLVNQPLPPATSSQGTIAGHPNSGPRPVPAMLQPQLRLSHAIPGAISGAVPNTLQPTSQRPRAHPCTSATQQLYQPGSLSHPVQMISPNSRALPSTPNTISSMLPITAQCQQPLIVYPPTSTTPIDNKTTSRQVSPYAQPVTVTGTQMIHYQGDNYGAAPGISPVLGRASNVASLSVASGNQQSDEPATINQLSGTGVHIVTPVSTGLSTPHAKMVRPSTPSGQKLGVVHSPVPKTSVSAAAVTHTPNVAVSSRTSQPGVPLSSRPSSRAFSGSASSKTSQEPQTPEVQAQIVSRLTAMASRYLPAVRHAIQLVSAQSESHLYVRKYTKLKDILENPEANLHVIRLGQVNLIEQLLNEIERNPMHLVQQHPQQQTKGAVSATPSVPPVAASSVAPSNKQILDSRKHGVPTASISDDQSRQRIVQSQQPMAQSSSRFRVPTTNLNTLLTQTGGSASPTTAMELHSSPLEPSTHSRSVTQFSPGSARATFASTSPDSGPNAVHPIVSFGSTPGIGVPSGSDSQTTRPPAPVSGQDIPPHRTASSFSSHYAVQARNFGPTGFHSSMQALMGEFQKMSDRASHDVVYGRRLARAINEISRETKPWRELVGLLLPQDLQHTCPKGDQKASKEAHCESDEVDFSTTSLTSYKRDRASPSIDMTGSVSTELLSETECDSQMLVDAPDRVEKKPFLQSGDVSMDSQTVDSCCSRLLEMNNRLLQDSALNIVGQGMVEDNDNNRQFTAGSNRLFMIDLVTDGPESLPSREFSADQLERLNPLVLQEIDQVRMHLRVCVQVNVTPPTIDDMETYATCMDSGEWNTSCHLKLTHNTEDTTFLPCDPPPLLVRLAPDYLKSSHMNWYFVPRSQYAPSLQVSDQSPYSVRERDEFLDMCYAELDRQLNRHLRMVSHYRINLYLVAKCWLDSVCAAVARFLKFDQNVFLV